MSRLFAGVVWGNVALRLQTTVALRRRQVLARKLVILALQSKFTVRYIPPWVWFPIYILFHSFWESAYSSLCGSEAKKERQRSSESNCFPSFNCVAVLFWACTHLFFIYIFFQLSSVSSVDEIKFKTIIPASSLVVRDHCWLNDAGKSSIFQFSSNILLEEPTALDWKFPVQAI